MVTLQNNTLKITIKPIGAELCEIASTKNGNQFLWDADPSIWGNFAPNLFPIVGMLKDETYHFEGESYQLPKHGFIRNNPNFQIVEESIESVTFSLNYNNETLKSYPFKFEFFVEYRLVENNLHITYKVINVDSKPLYFSVGGHPAFKCPVYDGETYKDYQLVFETEELSQTYLLNLHNGLVTNETKSVFDTSNTIQLHEHLFDHDALIFKDLKSRNVTLSSAVKGPVLTVHFKDFPYLGLWAKPKANYVCIEPWLGIADSEDTYQELTTKEGIIALPANEQFNATYTIEIHKSHLV